MNYTSKIFKLASKFEKFATTEEIISNMDQIVDHITTETNKILLDNKLSDTLNWKLKELDPEDISQDSVKREYVISCTNISRQVEDLCDEIVKFIKKYLANKKEDGVIDYSSFDIDIYQDRKDLIFKINIGLTKYL